MGNEWNMVSLGELANITSSKRIYASDYCTAGVPFYRSKEIIEKAKGNSISTELFISREKFDNIKNKFGAPKANDILLTSVGTLGIPYLVCPNEEFYFKDGNLTWLQNFIFEAYPRFVYIWLRSNIAKRAIDEVTIGSTQQALTIVALKSLKLKLPPLPEQKAIAHILGSLDDKIELNRKMNATLEGMAQALFKSWFVDFDPVMDNALVAGNAIPEELAGRAEIRRLALADGTANREAAEPFPDAFQLTEEMGWIPEGWEVLSLNQALQINPTIKLSKGTIAYYADMKALPTKGYSIDGVIKKEYSGGSKFQNEDVLVARITPCLENGKTGIVDFLPCSTDVGFGSTEFIVLRGKGAIDLPYVACLAREEHFRLHSVQSMVGSSGRQRVQCVCYDKFYIAHPNNVCILKKFSEITQPLFNKYKQQAVESRTLTTLRDTLLPELVSGELRIPEAEKIVEEAL